MSFTIIESGNINNYNFVFIANMWTKKQLNNLTVIFITAIILAVTQDIDKLAFIQ